MTTTNADGRCMQCGELVTSGGCPNCETNVKYTYSKPEIQEVDIERSALGPIPNVIEC